MRVPEKRPSVVIAMAPLLFGSLLVGLLMGLGVPLVGWAAKKLREHGLLRSGWPYTAFAIGALYLSPYPLMLKWHFHADSIFSFDSAPPQFRWAELSYSLGKLCTGVSVRV